MSWFPKPAGALAFTVLASLPAAAYDLPPDLPVRKPGLWESVARGSLGPQMSEVEIVKRICLDGPADRAFHDRSIQEMESSVVTFDGECAAPELELSGNLLSGTMRCTSNAFDKSQPGGADFRWTVRFESDSEVVVDHYSNRYNTLAPGESRYVERQKWIGDCAPAQKPGDGLDMSFKIGGRESLKGMRETNVYESLEIGRKHMKEMKGLYSRVPE